MSEEAFDTLRELEGTYPPAIFVDMQRDTCE